MGARQSPDKHKRQPARVARVARRDNGGQRGEDGLGALKRLGEVGRKEVFPRGGDIIVRNRRLCSNVSLLFELPKQDIKSK